MNGNRTTKPSTNGPNHCANRDRVFDGAAVDLREQERAHRPAVCVEAFRVAPQPQEHLLHHFLGEHPVGQDPARESEARARVPVVQLAQREPVAVADDPREFAIGRRAPLRVRHGGRPAGPTSHTSCSEPIVAADEIGSRP